MKKILHIVGARPQFIKLAPFLHKSSDVFNNLVLHTGQHYDKSMSDSFFDDLDIPEPQYNLNVGSALQGEQTAKMLVGIEHAIMKEQPEAVVVYGDTNSTLAGALAAVKLGVFTAHIEACLRSFNRAMPEEINRICTDHICNLLFAPTVTAMQNAEQEGLSKVTHLVGDIMTDSLAYGLAKAEKVSAALSVNNLNKGEYYLLTLHRPYTVDNPAILVELLTKLNGLDKIVVFPVHPRTANILAKSEINSFSNIRMIAPQSYLDFICLMSNSKMVLTDSGGIQKEAYILKKGCATLRSETEWLETVQTGWNCLINPSEPDLAKLISAFSTPEIHPVLFGENVSKQIIELLNKSLK